MPREPIPPELRQLIGAPMRLSAQRLWRALESEERSAALRAVLPDRETRTDIVRIIAEVRNFRRITVQNWDDDKLVPQAQSIILPNPLAAVVLNEWHLARRREMLARFLESLRIPNDDGVPLTETGEEGFGRVEVEAAAVHEAADELEREHGLRRVVVYFLMLAILDAPFANDLWDWLGGLAERLEAEAEADPRALSRAGGDVYEEPEEDVAEDDGHPGRIRSFTTLDRLVMEAVADSRHRVVGSLDRDEVDDAVEEFVHLNGKRPQSHFHVGFRDALFRRSPDDASPAGGSERPRWYWAGAIEGWARSKSWNRIVAAYEHHTPVRGLGDGSFAADEAALHIVRALAHEGRPGQVADFVRAEALVRSRALFRETLEIGTDLLRDGEEGAARTVFERLMEAVREMEARGDAPASRRFLTVRRRRAHCLQRLFEHDRARKALEELLDIDPDPNLRAMVEADIGLLAGGFNGLADVRLPQEESELTDLVDRLGEGRDRFERAVQNGVAYAAHGAYCLGVLALGQQALRADGGEYGDAEERLLQARNRFEARSESYDAALVARTTLYFGIARASGVESPAHLVEAANIMVRALKAGAAFPPYLVDPVLEALELGAGSDALSSFAGTIVEAAEPAALGALARSDTALRLCPGVADGLRDRARQRGLTEEAAADLRTSLTGYLAAGRREDARSVLDRLEALAARGVGDEQFKKLLADRLYQPAWEPEDAEIALARCLEARGERLEAVQLLEPLVHRFASAGDLPDAEGLLNKIRSFGVGREYYKGAADRVTALKRQHRVAVPLDAEAPPRARRVRVLFVGGDERQERAEHAVRDLMRRRAPHVDVSFIYPGWSGNWSRPFNRVRSELDKHDAVVVMRFMRTELGRRIRRECRDKPWRSCWPSGRKGMVDAIVAAAEAAGG